MRFQKAHPKLYSKVCLAS